METRKEMEKYVANIK
jgi:hypothetical protein